MRRWNQSGLGNIAILLLVLVVAVVAFAGYKVADSTKVKPAVSTATTQASAPKAITSTADVEQAEASLDSANADSSINPDQLDQDLNELL